MRMIILFFSSGFKYIEKVPSSCSKVESSSCSEVEGNEQVVGDMKPVGLYLGRWKPKLDLDLGDPNGSGGYWHM